MGGQNNPAVAAHNGAVVGGNRTRRSGGKVAQPGDKSAALSVAAVGEVQPALRLGWQLAEVRGRCRRTAAPSRQIDDLGVGSLPLPLTSASERSVQSSTIEATVVLVSVAIQTGVDLPLDRIVAPPKSMAIPARP